MRGGCGNGDIVTILRIAGRITPRERGKGIRDGIGRRFFFPLCMAPSEGICKVCTFFLHEANETLIFFMLMLCACLYRTYVFSFKSELFGKVNVVSLHAQHLIIIITVVMSRSRRWGSRTWE